MELVKGRQTFEQEVRLLFRSMGRGDLYVHWGLDVLPYELEPAGWAVVGRDVARAVKKGATFVYLYPGQQLVDKAREWGLVRIADAGIFEPLIQTLRTRVAGLEKAVRRRDIENRLLAVSYDEQFFVEPGHEYFLLGRSTEDFNRFRLLVRQGIGIGERASSLLFSLTQSTTAAFVLAVKAALEHSAQRELLKYFD